MRNIFLSIAVSLIISIVGTNTLSKYTTKKWEMVLNYEHISRTLNVNYELIKDIGGIKNDTWFFKYIDTLDANISTPGKLNACSRVRGTSSTPNVLLTYDNSAVQIILQHREMGLLTKCENFIDEEMKKYSSNSKELIKRIISYKNIFLDNEETREGSAEAKNRKIVKLLKQSIVNTEGKKSLNFEDIQSLTTTIMLLDLLEEPKNKLMKDDELKKIDELEIISKTYKNLSQEKINVITVYLSLFAISQSLFLFIMYSNKIRRKNNFIKKYKSLFK